MQQINATHLFASFSNLCLIVRASDDARLLLRRSQSRKQPNRNKRRTIAPAMAYVGQSFCRRSLALVAKHLWSWHTAVAKAIRNGNLPHCMTSMEPPLGWVPGAHLDAAETWVHLCFVPAGFTGTAQPADRSFVRALKAGLTKSATRCASVDEYCWISRCLRDGSRE